MNESEPIKKTWKDLENKSGYYDYVSIGRNVWRVSEDGKYRLIKTAVDESAASLELLRREYELSCGLQHPFIVGTIRFEQNTEKGPAIVMEYIAGRNLREFIEEKPSYSKRRKVLMQILDAIEYLHRKGVLHNDIKPENILVTEIGDDVKIIDFGLSEISSDFLSRRLGGTPGFSAPEVLSGDTSSPSTGSSDVYSVGGIIKQLFPNKYAGVVRKCRRNNPSARYKGISSLRKAIEWRDRRIWIFLAVAVICALSTISIIPDRMREIKEQNEEEILQARIRKIQEDLTVFYKDAADSINNRRLVPYQEFAMVARGTFVRRTFEYRNRLEQDMLPVCDSIYARMIADLSEMLLDIPDFCSMDLPADEFRWYLDLFGKQKPYAPFVK